ncbi:MAG: DNA-directed RNA polymerase subunit F [Candidatus Aenigmarchaeota archaeon]|nr:DNA-directed RNA polymerase subunit F [Candidatus Aenigmarchaeota archaeon]
MMEIINEKLVTDAEAKEILEKRSKETEFGYEQKNALEHLRKYVKIDAKKAKELYEELKKVEKLRERQIIQIINILPKDQDDLRVILQKDFNILDESEVNLILEAVKKAL